jgi:hypothetical protein
MFISVPDQIRIRPEVSGPSGSGSGSGSATLLWLQMSCPARYCLLALLTHLISNLIRSGSVSLPNNDGSGSRRSKDELLDPTELDADTDTHHYLLRTSRVSLFCLVYCRTGYGSDMTSQN